MKQDGMQPVFPTDNPNFSIFTNFMLLGKNRLYN